MSVGSQALERSTLESKDRESLHQIATAMGGKPGSRAKKADIVTMILELAGVVEGGAPAVSGGGAGETAPGAQLSLDAATDEEAPAPAPAPRRTEAAPRATAAPAPEATEASDETGETGETGESDSDPAEGDAGDREGERGGRDPSGARGNHTATRDEGDQSNRRRRRRGRDRDRQGQPGAPAPAGAATPPTDDFQGEPVEVGGLLDLRDEGYGFLRVTSYLPSKEDVYVSVKQVRQFGLRKGDHLKGAARPASRNEKNPALLRIDEVNGAEPELNKQRARYEELTPCAPEAMLALAGAPGTDDDLTARVVDLVAPLGRGQRGMLVGAPRSGRTTLLTTLAGALAERHPDVHLMVLLVDERPEEVTGVRHQVDGEVIASTFDRPADEHIMVAELAIERAKRLVEDGRDVVILADGLTRLARAYNLAAPASGRLLPGGIDSTAVTAVKRFFGAARRVEEGGSLTMMATLLVGTGAPLDEAIAEQLTGTANLELHLDSQLAERRTYPAVDVAASASAHEVELLGPDRQAAVFALRRELHDVKADGGTAAALAALVARLEATPSNDALLDGLGGA
jgi:transcription termination factor Rho